MLIFNNGSGGGGGSVSPVLELKLAEAADASLDAMTTDRSELSPRLLRPCDPFLDGSGHLIHP